MAWTETEMTHCPRCRAELEFEGEDWRSHESCYFVPCDDETCEARKDPITLGEFKQTTEHWRRHSYLAGCSHGG